MKNKTIKSIALIYAIIALAFIVLTVAIPFPKPASSWTAFAFAIVSLVGGCAITIFAFGKADSLKSRIYGCPVFKIGIYYTAIQLCATLILYVLGGFFNVPYWIGLTLSIIIICVAAVGVIATDTARTFIQEIDNKGVDSAKAIETFTIDIADVLDMCNDEIVRAPLKKLADKFKYSDIVSTRETADIEDQITSEIEELKNMIATETSEAVIAKIGKISNLLSSRNRLCENSKRS